jgi:hypothetical protein
MNDRHDQDIVLAKPINDTMTVHEPFPESVIANLRNNPTDSWKLG